MYPHPSLLERLERHRLAARRPDDPTRKVNLGQFLTPPELAAFMASFFESLEGTVRVLDAGAGLGALVVALTLEAQRRRPRADRIEAVACEIDPALVAGLRDVLRACQRECKGAGVAFGAEVIEADFIAAAVATLDGAPGAAMPKGGFSHAILNPPYRKLGASSAARRALRAVGVDASNLYAAFLALAIRLLEPGGELVAITPRSFCNGPHFRAFRELLLREMVIRRLHVFDSRTAAFARDRVLQENIVLHAVKGTSQRSARVSSSAGPGAAVSSMREVALHDIVDPADPERFIHVAPDPGGHAVAEAIRRLPARLSDLGLSVSTGKVVDFRARPFLREGPGPGAHPLLYPTHLAEGGVVWPRRGKKPNALLDVPETQGLWMPGGTYVLVKRLSSKEEPRRVVAAVFDPARVPASRVGFENHLNVVHARGAGLPALRARGLVAFLNSARVDAYFRQFNGHTQVNATDLRSFKYPSAAALDELGAAVGDRRLATGDSDRLVEEALGS